MFVLRFLSQFPLTSDRRATFPPRLISRAGTLSSLLPMHWSPTLHSGGSPTLHLTGHRRWADSRHTWLCAGRRHSRARTSLPFGLTPSSARTARSGVGTRPPGRRGGWPEARSGRRSRPPVLRCSAAVCPAAAPAADRPRTASALHRRPVADRGRRSPADGPQGSADGSAQIHPSAGESLRTVSDSVRTVSVSGLVSLVPSGV